MLVPSPASSFSQLSFNHWYSRSIDRGDERLQNCALDEAPSLRMSIRPALANLSVCNVVLVELNTMSRSDRVRGDCIALRSEGRRSAAISAVFVRCQGKSMVDGRQGVSVKRWYCGGSCSVVMSSCLLTLCSRCAVCCCVISVQSCGRDAQSSKRRLKKSRPHNRTSALCLTSLSRRSLTRSAFTPTRAGTDHCSPSAQQSRSPAPPRALSSFPSVLPH